LIHRFAGPTAAVVAAALIYLICPDGVSAQAALRGVVHEATPTEDRRLADVRVQISGASSGPAATTDAEGRFMLGASPGSVLEFASGGYEPARITVGEAGAALDVAMMPVRRDVPLARSGANDCTDLPAPPPGVPGVREYARFPVHHDGTVMVSAAKLPFASNPGYLYRQTSSGWVKNEFDYVLLRQPLPVLGGFWYVLTFGEGTDRCGSWSIDATHPS
jgi:hypothetical protein